MSDAPAQAGLEMPPLVADLEGRARKFETPCGEGVMVWRAWGEGDPLVLAHGAQGGWVHWARNINALAQGRMVLIPDLPGHGESSEPAAHDHASISAALAQGLREILGERLPVDLLGFSFGGVCFANLAARHPQVARSLIVVGCGGLDTPVGHIDVGGIRGLEGEARLARLRANLLGLMLHNPDSVDDFAIWQLLTYGRKSRLNAQDFVLPDKLLVALRDVRVPVGAIWGENDRPHPDPEVQRQALLTVQPDVDFEVIAGAGHAAMMDRPEAFDRTALAMLERLLARAG